MTKSSLLRLSAGAESMLIAGARDPDPVKGLTHGFYKYPARFSPTFARTAIESFTQPGDMVLDNHVGGGTTLVEALVAGRHAIGIDISALAEFVATALAVARSAPTLGEVVAKVMMGLDQLVQRLPDLLVAGFELRN